MTRHVSSGRAGLRLLQEGRASFAELALFDGDRAFVRARQSFEPGDAVRAEWTGPGRLTLDAEVEAVDDAAPDGRYGVALRVLRVTSGEGAPAVVRFVTGQLGLPLSAAPTQAGATWWVALSEAGETVGGPVEKAGPPPRVAGVRADQEPAAPLVTGRPDTTVEILAKHFEDSSSKVGVYLNVPCSYTVAGAQYWGRALRLNDRWLQINTNSVVPGLGVRMRADLTTEIDGQRRPVSLFGVMNRRTDPPAGGMFKATLALRIHRIDEGDSPGLLIEFLERVHAAKQRREDP